MELPEPRMVIENCAIATEAVRRFHDPSPGAMVRVAVAPCSPFSVSSRLMREMTELARGLGVRLHTHLAETREEDVYCRQTLSRTPAEYADELGWLGEDVWLAHCVHLDEADGDPVAALVFGPPAPLELLLVGGRPVVERGELRTIDMPAAVREVRAARRWLEPGT
jgi:cytosine/adenosine deaminase-related metal-dependent hydrolase